MGNCIITRRGLPSEASVKQEGIYPIGTDGRPMGNVIVPDCVTRLYKNIFYSDQNVWSVALPNSIISVDNNAFADCTSLTSVNIPDGMEKIPDCCFMNCRELRVVEINTEADCNSIGSQAFYECVTLKKITFPYGLRSIGDYAFYDCQSLSEINLPATIDAIANNTFYNCQAIREIVLSPNIVVIGNNAFRYNYYVQSVHTPESVNSKYTITLPSVLNTIGNSAFEGCFSHISSGATMLLPKSVTAIGERAFYHCVNLKHIDIEDDTEFNIQGKHAFAYCDMLDDESVLNITSHINNIDIYLFNNCSGLKNVNTKRLYSYMFSDCANLESITGTNTGEISGEYIINSCPKLKSVILDSAGTNISNNAFRGCVSLETLKINGTSSNMGTTVFYGDNGLKNLYLPATIVSCTSNSLTSTSASYYFLNGCTALENVVLGLGWSISVRLDVSDNLTHDSLVETINNLADLNALGKSSQTLTIGSTNKNKLSADEITIATSKGWSIV